LPECLYPTEVVRFWRRLSPQPFVDRLPGNTKGPGKIGDCWIEHLTDVGQMLRSASQIGTSRLLAIHLDFDVKGSPRLHQPAPFPGPGHIEHAASTANQLRDPHQGEGGRGRDPNGHDRRRSPGCWERLGVHAGLQCYAHARRAWSVVVALNTDLIGACNERSCSSSLPRSMGMRPSQKWSVSSTPCSRGAVMAKRGFSASPFGNISGGKPTCAIALYTLATKVPTGTSGPTSVENTDSLIACRRTASNPTPWTPPTRYCSTDSPSAGTTASRYRNPSRPTWSRLTAS